jgi:hypothetical protein
MQELGFKRAGKHAVSSHAAALKIKIWAIDSGGLPSIKGFKIHALGVPTPPYSENLMFKVNDLSQIV